MDILQGIHAANDYERSLFGAVKEPFRAGLNRWYSDIRPDQVNNNFFEPIAEITVEDIQAAIDQQKRRGLNYVLFRMNQPMHPPCRDSFEFEKEVMYVMALRRDRSRLWQSNDSIVIRDIQSSDISADLLDVSCVPEQYRDAAYRNMKMVLDVAETHPEYYWLCANQDGNRVGTVYALEHEGFVEMDDLWVEEDYRHRKIGTTLMKYIAEHTEGILYLHADAAATPKDMYAKMGFEIVETVYEYYLEW